MLAWVNSHGLELMAAYFLFNALISGMPEPTASSSTGYMWLFRSLHTLGGNLDKIVASNHLPAGSVDTQTFTQETRTVSKPSPEQKTE